MDCKKIFMLGCSTLVAGAAFTACGDDSSSGSVYRESDDVQELNFKVDTENKTISISYLYTEEMCVTDSLHTTFKWDVVQSGNIQESYTYVTIGDTLVMLRYYEDEEEYESLVLLGGDTKTLNGTWEALNCDYVDDALECYESIKNRTKTLTISDGKAVSKVTYAPVAVNDDYMNSEFTADMIWSLAKGSNDMYIGSLGDIDSEYVDVMIEKYDIEVLNQSKDSMSFVLDGQTFDYKVNRFSKSSGRISADVVVSSGGETCSIDYEYAFADESFCKASNAEYFSYENSYVWDFDKDTYKRDEDGNRIKYYYAYSYENVDDVEFGECVINLKVDASVDDALKTLAKKAPSGTSGLGRILKAQDRFFSLFSAK